MINFFSVVVSFTLLRQPARDKSGRPGKALWPWSPTAPPKAGKLATGMNGVLGFPLRSDSFGGQVAGFRKACPSSARDSTCVAKATPAQQVAPRLPPSPKGLWRTGAAWCFTIVFIVGQSPAEEISAERIAGEVLEHSYHLKIAGDQVAAAEAVKKQADAALFPSLDLDGRVAHYEGLKENNFPNLRIPAIPDRYGSGVTLTQPLYTGGKISGQKQMTDEQRLSAKSSFAARRADVIYQALIAYWSWSKAFYAAESFRAAVAWMESHDSDMQNLRAAGLATENDRLSTSVRLDQTRLRLEEALRYTYLCRAAIERLTGKTLSETAAPSRPAGNDLPPVSGEQELIQGALTNRPDVQAQQSALNAARKNIQIQSANYFPQLNANIRGEVGRPNQLNIPPQDEWLFDAFAGVSVSWNILDWGLTRAKVSEARARANQAGHQLSQLNEQIIFEVRQALINLQNFLTRVRVARRAEESARLDLKAATDLWKNGLARHSDVLDSQSRLTDASYDLVAAGADLELARAELEHAYGIAASAYQDNK